ncbi:hypothetical protein FRUB_00791 [Fimbriiglobus ruber]|uniref:Uncharacterized protein n=1 Tax=Fimbriiglobus ruber TaxID=1908690 RepID=A0A225E0K5_9BACT|nr:hypothetical protein FRUB_00791 [Fimbriiglobus ruber]
MRDKKPLKNTDLKSSGSQSDQSTPELPVLLGDVFLRLARQGCRIAGDKTKGVKLSVPNGCEIM